MNFSKWLVLNNVAQFVFTRADTFVIGKISGAQALGIYSIAAEISNLPTSELLAPIRRALYPGYAKLQSHPTALRENFVQTLAVIVAIAVPMAVGIGLVGDPLVRVALGEKWIDAIPIIQILAVYAVLNVCSANIWPIYLALGKPEIFALVMGISAVTVVPLLLVATNMFGILGAAWAVVMAVFVQLALNVRLITRLLNLPSRVLFLATGRTIGAAIVMAVFVAAIQFYWPPTATFGDNLALLAACVVSGAVLYVGAHFVLWRIHGSPRGSETILMTTVRSLCRNLAGNRVG